MKKLELKPNFFCSFVGYLKLLMLFAVALTFLATPSRGIAKDRIEITFRNPFSPSGSWAMFWSCQDRYWPEEGVYGEVQDGKGYADVVKAVGAGSAQMGYTATPAVMDAVQKGMPIRIILIGEQKEPTALMTLKSKGYKTLKDFEGKTVGMFPFGWTGVLVKGMLAKNGVDLSKIKFVNVPPGGTVAMLMTGKVDAFCGSASFQDLHLLKKGGDPQLFLIRDYGLNIRGVVAVVVNTNWEKKVGRDVVLKYARGIGKSFILQKTNVKKMIDVMVKYRPDQSMFYDSRLAECYLRWRYKYDSDTVDKHGFGWIKKSDMVATQNTLFDVGILKKKMDVEKYYTMDYITDPTFRPIAETYAKDPLDPNLKHYYDKFLASK